MNVLCVGGGSGGHVTPVLPVIRELKKHDPGCRVTFVCDRAFEQQSRGLMAHAGVPVTVRVIAAGKLRRYHGVPVWKQLLDVPTTLKNLRDVLYIGFGFVQSLLLLRRIRPDVVFAKGGYVCLPVGYAAHVLRIPLVIHDSDTRPGLTNRVLSRFATKIATGSPLENYAYPAERSVYTGVPIDGAFRPVTPKQQLQAKQAIGIVDCDKPLVVIVGGGLGAQSINEGVVAVAGRLLDDGFSLYHVTGKRHYRSVKAAAPEHPDYHITDFVYKDMVTVLGAADIVVSRASATFLQELAALAKPTLVVPAGHLSDQVKNAEVYRQAKAAYVLDDAAVRGGQALYETLDEWRRDPAAAADMSAKFHAFAKPAAAADVARLIILASGDTVREA